ncbi:unnamed protein product [Aspergillus oryzae RIB40]|uniref:DNA, SC038 n=2 Tax=Aspergillus oryzae TaxID=5062 RepID=Q2U3C7_ASPOR|nr:unnamed protein product [Aspergillus oryzae RIB40]EIT76305.1 hypothetical protein Ao3042_07552 [Aspergillus oryzae 3.042]KDE83422.1 hypothetical protein AO1008_10001 [Aspergillus oryzae 100-8]BAE63938.1 unnamed protein product [Aspergillus oryzae RIB40]|eukprot:EIT76305.1 hypothetical protein Ao3042_07552 [Aspergillus oryzae 3.042]
MKWTAILIALSAVSTQALESRDFDGKVTCGGGLPADYKAIKGGIDYLNGVGGTPVEDPNKCGRVSCSYNSAIYMCNWALLGRSRLQMDGVWRLPMLAFDLEMCLICCLS